MIYFFKLLFAHILADFPLQPKALVKAKQSEKLLTSLGTLFIHSMIHAILAYVFIASWSNWLLPFVIFLSHFLIDLLKAKVFKDNTMAFILDQGLHILALVALWYFMFQKPSQALELNCLLNNLNFWIIATSYLAVLKPSSLLLRKFVRRWTPLEKSDVAHQQIKSNSLQSAGAWIGYIERVLILTFIFLNYFEGIGFLLAAKSIFRFGDLRSPAEVKQTEYVLVGTLASFAIASTIGGLAFMFIRS